MNSQLDQYGFKKENQHKPAVIDFHVCGVTLPIKAGKSYLSCHI
jgi:hypothetical protein